MNGRRESKTAEQARPGKVRYLEISTKSIRYALIQCTFEVKLMQS